MRKRRDRHVPCVVAEREKKALKAQLKKAAGDHPKKDSKQVSSRILLNNYIPQKPVTEDAVSTESHKNFMIKECPKKKRDERKILQCMELTFYDRRQKIVRQLQSIKTMKEEYPCLFDAYQVSNSVYNII